jgi:hypothetical protein
MSNWDDKLIKPSSPPVSAIEEVHALFKQQRATWPKFRDGEATLDAIRTKSFSLENHRIVVQANPGRVISSGAKVDPASVAKRPCFLCPDTLPPLERGISFGDYIILPNPYPILKYHLTIPHRNHLPQRIEGRVEDLCALTKAISPEMFVIYNGPRCGASAPDHMHFQACGNENIPLFEQLPIAGDKDQVVPISIWGRNMLVCSFREAGQAEKSIRSIIIALKEILGEKDEPMMNMVSLYRNDRYIITIFPRAKHRSACYFAGPSRRILISPAAMEMAGIIVVANLEHFDRVDETVVRSIYQEVTLGTDLFSRLVEAVT